MEQYIERTPTFCQADNMAKYAGIELTRYELQMYIWARQSDDKDFLGMSDQSILDMCLSPDKQVIFEEFFTQLKGNR